MTAQEHDAYIRQSEYEHKKKLAQRRKKKAQRNAILVVMGIAVFLFAIGTLFGWHLGTVHAVTPTTQELDAQQPLKTKSVSAIKVATDKPEPIPCTENVIVSDGNTLAPELQEAMVLMCDKYKVPYALALAVAEKETHFNPDAKSRTNDYGLCR